MEDDLEKKYLRMTVRLDHVFDDDRDRLLEFLKSGDRYVRYVIFEEISDKTKKLHYQGVVEMHNNSKNHSWHKERWSRIFKTHTVGHKSSAFVKKDEYMAYIAKDDNILVYHGYDEEYIKSLKGMWKKNDEEYDEDYKKKTAFVKLLTYCKNNNITYSSSGWDIVEVIIDYYAQESRCEPNDFQLRQMAISIQRQLVFESGDKNIWSRYKRQRAQQIIGSSWTHVSL